MAQISKNARRGGNAQKFFCSCGKEIKMRGIFKKGRLRWIARCEGCGTEKRRPSEFK